MKKKTVFKILGGIAIVAAAIVGLVFYVTSDMTGAADKFFETARGGDAESVYALTSAELRNTTSAEQLAAFIELNRFDQVADTSWSSRSIDGGLGRVEGSVTLDDGGVVPLTMQLVKEGDGWKISFIELREAGLSGGVGPATDGSETVESAAGLPPEGEILGAVDFHTGVFLSAAQREGLGLQSGLEYFQEFWIDGVTMDQLQQLVAEMRGKKAAAEALSYARPVVERASPLEGGGFQATGYLEAAPWRYDYRYAFAPDGERWKLSSFEYELSERQ